MSSRLESKRAWAALLVGAAFAACGAGCAAETGVILAIDGQPDALEGSPTLDILLTGADGPSGVPGPLSLPYRLLVTPRGGDASRGFDATLTLSDDSGPIAIVRAQGVQFSAGELRVLPVCFSNDCLAASLACGSAEACESGECVALAPAQTEPLSDSPPPCAPRDCPAGFANCDGDFANGCETDLSDNTTCGACDRRCGADAPLCEGDRGCVLECGDGFTECGGSCANLATSAAHCGACGNACDERCAEGRCVTFRETPARCADGIDNDADGECDCGDADCECAPEERGEGCRDGLDNDFDGAIDGADESCFGEPAPPMDDVEMTWCALAPGMPLSPVDTLGDPENCGGCNFACQDFLEGGAMREAQCIGGRCACRTRDVDGVATSPGCPCIGAQCPPREAVWECNNDPLTCRAVDERACQNSVRTEGGVEYVTGEYMHTENNRCRHDAPDGRFDPSPPSCEPAP